MYSAQSGTKQNLILVCVYSSTLLQMHHSKSETQCNEHFARLVLATQVLNLGLRHA